MPKTIAIVFALATAAATPTAPMAELTRGFASIAGPQMPTPRYVNTPSRHCIKRKPTTIKSPNELLGSSHRLYRSAMQLPPDGEVVAYLHVHPAPAARSSRMVPG